MKMQKNALNAFLFWLVCLALGTVVYWFYIGPPGSRFIQIVLIGALLSLCLFFVGLKATKISKNFATLLAVCWFFGAYVFFALAPSLDPRLLLLLLLGIGLSLNAALSVIIKRRALH